jgi:GTP cyclohydrolase II
MKTVFQYRAFEIASGACKNVGPKNINLLSINNKKAKIASLFYSFTVLTLRREGKTTSFLDDYAIWLFVV